MFNGECRVLVFNGKCWCLVESAVPNEKYWGLMERAGV